MKISKIVSMAIISFGLDSSLYANTPKTMMCRLYGLECINFDITTIDSSASKDIRSKIEQYIDKMEKIHEYSDVRALGEALIIWHSTLKYFGDKLNIDTNSHREFLLSQAWEALHPDEKANITYAIQNIYDHITGDKKLDIGDLDYDPKNPSNVYDIPRIAQEIFNNSIKKLEALGNETIKDVISGLERPTTPATNPSNN
ncbi:MULTISPECIES: hypothetical protein [Campylobacter]|uniref:Uncharacterized protein n=1 Tax=Campylobacter porcelli TaxID=1660073 RepID=A0A1X9SVN3_9BACT|nr:MULTISPECIES: hypothetical protein [unclassified Campylobacter]ARR00179.1 hypothetical protein CSUIS_0338 [Campylobacter sp. RM6137]MCR8697062.1 hypothetical protein [Campylobacter sp. RM19073]MEE3705114.1 hypothetical protein [Campylobacter sp. CX2-8023-23]MEE3744735.1 hypothetical protein [Campylobacter sp. CX2-4855-23]